MATKPEHIKGSRLILVGRHHAKVGMACLPNDSGNPVVYTVMNEVNRFNEFIWYGVDVTVPAYFGNGPTGRIRILKSPKQKKRGTRPKLTRVTY